MQLRQTLRKTERLRNVVEQSRQRLIEAEFNLATTLCDLAETELRRNDLKHAGQLISKAGEAAQVIRRIVEHASLPPGDRDVIDTRLLALETRSREIRGPVEKLAGGPA